MKQRAVLVSAFVLMIVFVLVTVAFFSSALSAKQNTSNIIPTLPYAHSIADAYASCQRSICLTAGCGLGADAAECQ